MNDTLIKSIDRTHLLLSAASLFLVVGWASARYLGYSFGENDYLDAAMLPIGGALYYASFLLLPLFPFGVAIEYLALKRNKFTSPDGVRLFGIFYAVFIASIFFINDDMIYGLGGKMIFLCAVLVVLFLLYDLTANTFGSRGLRLNLGQKT